jgi:hypothetical protein
MQESLVGRGGGWSGRFSFQAENMRLSEGLHCISLCVQALALIVS